MASSEAEEPVGRRRTGPPLVLQEHRRQSRDTSASDRQSENSNTFYFLAIFSLIALYPIPHIPRTLAHIVLLPFLHTRSLLPQVFVVYASIIVTLPPVRIACMYVFWKVLPFGTIE